MNDSTSSTISENGTATLTEAEELSALREKLEVAHRFPEHAFFLIEICHRTNSSIASWNEAGDSIVIKDRAVFEKSYLNTSFDTFRRQLQLYAFEKVNDKRKKIFKGEASSDFIFKHPCFLKGRMDLLRKIQSVNRHDERKMNSNEIAMTDAGFTLIASNNRSEKISVDTIIRLYEQKLLDLDHRWEQKLQHEISALNQRWEYQFESLKNHIHQMVRTASLPVQTTNSSNKKRTLAECSDAENIMLRDFLPQSVHSSDVVVTHRTQQNTDSAVLPSCGYLHETNDNKVLDHLAKFLPNKSNVKGLQTDRVVDTRKLSLNLLADMAEKQREDISNIPIG